MYFQDMLRKTWSSAAPNIGFSLAIGWASRAALFYTNENVSCITQRSALRFEVIRRDGLVDSRLPDWYHRYYLSYSSSLSKARACTLRAFLLGFASDTALPGRAGAFGLVLGGLSIIWSINTAGTWLQRRLTNSLLTFGWWMNPLLLWR